MITLTKSLLFLSHQQCLARSHSCLGSYWQLEPANSGHKMFYFALRVETMDPGGPRGPLEPIKDPGGTPKQTLLKNTSPQMSKKVKKCEFCLLD